MKPSVLHISEFRRDANFYGDLDLILTVKSFELQAIRKRYIASRANKSGKAGSVERRKPSDGGVITLRLANGKVHNEEVICRVKEPRGIDRNEQQLALATENKVHLLGIKGSHILLEDPWFSYIHTLDFHPELDNRVLISSSGFDMIMEYDFSRGIKTYEWLAWEHGFDKGHNPLTGQEFFLTRDPDKAQQLEEEGQEYLLIEDPLANELPTAKRAAFINSVCYDPSNPDLLIATFFHEGALYGINSKSGEARLLMDGMKNPHGGHRSSGKLVATSTATGEVWVQEEDRQLSYRFTKLPGKPDGLEELEWIQNTLVHDNLMIAIDSNRNSFVIFDPDQQLYDMIPYNKDWAVQDLISGTLSASQADSLKSLTSAT